MRVAYFINQYPKVSHAFIRREILALERRGVQVFRYALRGWDAQVVDPDDEQERSKTRHVLADGVWPVIAEALVFALRHPMLFLGGLGKALSLARGGDRTVFHHVFSLLEAVRLRGWLQANRVEHLHAHFGTNSAEVAMLARRLGGPPFSFTIHGPDEWDQPQQLKLREKTAAAAFVVGISAFTCAQLTRWCEVADLPKLHVVHCGVDPLFLGGDPPPAPDNRRLVCVGRLSRQKSQHLLVDAVARLRDLGIDLELVLAGDGELRAELEQRIRDLGLQDRARITGWVSAEQVRELLLGSRALVLASAMEGLPVVIMEAMALRRPVIVTSVAGIPELVRHGQDGWVVPAGSVQALAQAMREALEAPIDELRRMGEAARVQVGSRHDVDVEAGRLVELMRASVAAG
jgi:glycosyltransferase involved in cell wall biosynthesis